MWFKFSPTVALLLLLVALTQTSCNANAATEDVDAGYMLSKLHDLNDETWKAMLTGEWLVEFFAPWCPACRNLQPTWERVAVSAGILGVHVGKVDVTTSPALSGRFLVSALPTIYHVKDGVFRQYKGSRGVEAFTLFLKDKQWSKLEPISTWKKPDSIQMSLLSQLFKLSNVLKEYNNMLYDQYGLPSWACYSLFTIITMVVSATLGLMFICVIDIFYPPKKERESFSESKDRVEEVPNDEIEDDAQEQEDDEEEEEQKEENEEDTSDGEKNSQSEDSDEEDEETDKQAQVEKDEDKKKTSVAAAVADKEEEEEKPSPRELRKRKPRKAD